MPDLVSSLSTLQEKENSSNLRQNEDQEQKAASVAKGRAFINMIQRFQAELDFRGLFSGVLSTTERATGSLPLLCMLFPLM